MAHPLNGVQEVPGSNPGAPTSDRFSNEAVFFIDSQTQVQ